MSDQTKLEARLLTAAELEVVNATRPPAIEQASDEQLKVLAQRPRRARDRAKDIGARALNVKGLSMSPSRSMSP
jgi:hypothetical protein